jgi:hypothetical protein
LIANQACTPSVLAVAAASRYRSGRTARLFNPQLVFDVVSASLKGPFNVLMEARMLLLESSNGVLKRRGGTDPERS